MDIGTVYLIPSLLDESGLNAIPPYIIDAIKQSEVFFVENERTARRYLKRLWKEMVIDDYEWFAIDKVEQSLVGTFKEKLAAGKTVAIISEAGCPGVADPGQLLVAAAQEMGATVKPFVGPSSILLALMASGMNGQSFQFVGYLPIDNTARAKAIKDLEVESAKKNCTQIFIETPYRNNQLLEVLLKTLNPATKLGIAVNLTGEAESVKTKPVKDWRATVLDLHKKPVIFLILA